MLESQNKIGVCGYQFKNEIIKLGIPKQNVFIFSNMVDTNIYFDKFHISMKPKTMNILFCAHPLIKEKGIIEFLHSIPFIIDDYPNCNFLIMGGGNYINNFTLEAQKLNIQSKVNFLGYVSLKKKIEIFKNSKILIFPSYSEGFPSTVIEAMASGVAIISTSVGGLSSAIKDGENGFIINSLPPIPAEIALKTKLLINNKELLQTMMNDNFLQAKNKYDVKVVTKKFENEYVNIIN